MSDRKREEEEILLEYAYTGKYSGNIFHPIYYRGCWFLVGRLPTTLNTIKRYCNLSDEDYLFLKLRYGE
jgi:hypothetical protein